METPCWFPFEGHKYGRRNVKIAKSQKKSVTSIFSLHESCPGRHLHAASLKSFGNSSVPISQNEEPFRTEHLYTAISRKFVGKSARDNLERHCGWFWVQCSSKKFERMAQEAMDVFAKEATKVGSTAYTAKNRVLIISNITFQDCRVHIFSDMLSIAVNKGV